MTEPQPTPKRTARPERFLRRFGLAVAASVLLHLAAAVLMQPDYASVRDHVGLKDIVTVGIEQGRRPSPAPEAPSAPEPPPSLPQPKAPPPKKPKEKDAIALPTAPSDSSPAETTTADTAGDTSTTTATTEPDTQSGGSAGTDSGDDGTDSGQGEAICLHDLFAYATKERRWALWLSLSSLRGTVFEGDVSRALRAFEYTRELEASTGLDPGTDIEGLLVAASDVLDWHTFEIVASYDSGEERLRSRLLRSLGQKPGAVVVNSPAGWEINVPGQQRYHLVGSGRVLYAAYSEPQLAQAPQALDSESTAPAQEGATVARHSSHGDNPAWPKDVECLTPSGANDTPRSPLALDAAAAKVDLLTRALRPLLYANDEGRVPVMAMATTDPRAMGLHRPQLRGNLVVRGAVLRAYFGEQVQLEAFVAVDGDPSRITALAESWKARIAGAAQDAFLKMTGLGRVLPRVEVVSSEKGVRLRLVLSPGEVRAALVFMQMQGKVLDRQGPH